MFNHTKDVTFAAAMMGATYALLRAARDLPRPRLRDVLLFGVMLGAALGLRAMGLLLGVYLGARDPRWSLSTASRRALASGSPSSAARCSRSVPALVLGYLIMIAAWPWAALDAVQPGARDLRVRAISTIRSATCSPAQVYAMDDMPRWYLPAYLAIKLPLSMLAGAAIALSFASPCRGCARRDAPRTRARDRIRRFHRGCSRSRLQVIGHGPAFSGHAAFHLRRAAARRARRHSASTH